MSDSRNGSIRLESKILIAGLGVARQALKFFLFGCCLTHIDILRYYQSVHAYKMKQQAR